MSAVNQIRYRNFWPNFDKKDNFIARALANVTSNEKVEVWSVFQSVPKRIVLAMADRVGVRHLNLRGNKLRGIERKEQRKVWYTGENVRPPFSEEFDAFISYDQDPMGGKNCYFPLFYVDLLIEHPEASTRLGIAHGDASSLTAPRDSTVVKRKGVCAFISNPEPTRLRAIHELEKWIDVDVFGPYSGKRVDNKFSVAQDYKYMLCFENDLFPGYVTEKLLDAYLCRTVPLYWGDLGVEPHINRSSFVNAADFESLEKFAAYVGGMSDEEYSAIFQQSLLLSLPKVDNLIQALTGLRA